MAVLSLVHAGQFAVAEEDACWWAQPGTTPHPAQLLRYNNARPRADPPSQPAGSPPLLPHSLRPAPLAAHDGDGAGAPRQRQQRLHHLARPRGQPTSPHGGTQQHGLPSGPPSAPSSPPSEASSMARRRRAAPRTRLAQGVQLLPQGLHLLLPLRAHVLQWSAGGRGTGECMGTAGALLRGRGVRPGALRKETLLHGGHLALPLDSLGPGGRRGGGGGPAGQPAANPHPRQPPRPPPIAPRWRPAAAPAGA